MPLPPRLGRCLSCSKHVILVSAWFFPLSKGRQIETPTCLVVPLRVGVGERDIMGVIGLCTVVHARVKGWCRKSGISKT